MRKERASSACAEGMMLPELQRSRWKTKTKTRGFFFPHRELPLAGAVFNVIDSLP